MFVNRLILSNKFSHCIFHTGRSTSTQVHGVQGRKSIEQIPPTLFERLKPSCCFESGCQHCQHWINTSGWLQENVFLKLVDAYCLSYRRRSSYCLSYRRRSSSFDEHKWEGSSPAWNKQKNSTHTVMKYRRFSFVSW